MLQDKAKKENGSLHLLFFSSSPVISFWSNAVMAVLHFVVQLLCSRKKAFNEINTTQKPLKKSNHTTKVELDHNCSKALFLCLCKRENAIELVQKVKAFH